MSPFYTAALILNPSFYTRYIELHQLKKWRVLVLVKVKKLQEKYREAVIPILVSTPFSYENQNQVEPQELDAFDWIALSLRSIARLASKDEYKDYNSQELYNPSKKRALVWWY